MTIYTSLDDGKEINIDFPKEKYKKIKEKLGIRSKKDKENLKELQLIFLAAIKEFRRGWMSSDELGEIGNHIFFSIKDKNELAWKGYAAGEVSYYIRAVGNSPQSEKTLNSFLNEIFDYYQTYKLKIENYK